MFYANTVAAIRSLLEDRGFCDDNPDRTTRGPDIYLSADKNLVAADIYAYCNNIEFLDTSEVGIFSQASHASFQIGFAAALTESFFRGSSFGLGRVLSRDTKMGFDKPHRRPVLGIDFGRTICDIGAGHVTTGRAEVDPQFFTLPFVNGAVEAIKSFAPLFGPRSMHIVSKCAPESEGAIKEWLARKNFWQLTGMREGNIHFCRERHEKNPICCKLGVTHFVDDRREVLAHMSEVRTRVALNPRDDDPDEKPFLNQPYRPTPWEKLNPILVAPDWAKAGELIRGSFNPNPTLVSV